MEAVHPNYKAGFYTEELGYRGTFEALMTYLVQEFGKKTQQELDTNELELKKPWNAATVPIQALFFRVDKCRRFDPTIPEANIVRIVVGIICSNKGFGADCLQGMACYARCRQDMDQPQGAFSYCRQGTSGTQSYSRSNKCCTDNLSWVGEQCDYHATSYSSGIAHDSSEQIGQGNVQGNSAG
jgi:hypothetical protein